jgi:transcriptional regulator with XRE-family HTH domain
MGEYKFGDLVKARLIELKWSQSYLAKRVGKGRSYINYVVTGKNRTAKNKESKPGPNSVELIAQALGIPADEALIAAGWQQFVGKNRSAQATHAPDAAGPGGATTHEADDNALQAIAGKAALDAIRQTRSGSTCRVR